MEGLGVDCPTNSLTYLINMFGVGETRMFLYKSFFFITLSKIVGLSP